MTKLNAIEEIMVAALGSAQLKGYERLDWDQIRARDILAALDAAGLAVVPKDSAAMDEWIKKWTFEGGIYDDAPQPPK